VERCGSVPAGMPLCSGQSTTSAAFAAVLGTAVAAALVLAAVTVHRRRQAARNRREASQLGEAALGWRAAPDCGRPGQPSTELANLLAAQPTLSLSACGSDAGADAGGTAAAPAAASWQLRSASLRLGADDFSISIDSQGRPILLGSGAFSKVRPPSGTYPCVPVCAAL
jgi:hypothetical protein